MRHTLIELGYRPRQIQGYANDLRASGYAALGDAGRLERRRALEHLTASLSELDLAWVQVGSSCPLAGRTLAELDLRAQTGASAVALRRSGEIEVFLDADTRICSGDQVGLVGTAEQVDAAAALLAACDA